MLCGKVDADNNRRGPEVRQGEGQESGAETFSDRVKLTKKHQVEDAIG